MDVMKAVESLQSDLWGVWFLIGAALVFWMQAGFAMVEGGFTRAKNAGNIIMKNLMDFCIGTVMFMLIGFSLLLGEDYLGFIGKPGFDLFTNFANFNFSTFVFNLVFCATTATIVSGAMAERTKFLSYCVYSAVISALIYPIEAHWIWGGGWLANLGFHDYAGSCAIHMVGGICALIGAAFLGPRIGKFKKDKSGKVIKVNAIPGHNLTIGALGVFILWLGWYGFNGAAATDLKTLGSIFLTTTVAPAVATVVCMIFTWIKYGKPDVSMCLNASLAGLVAITAPCDVTDALGAAIIGAVAGVLVVFGVWLCDHVQQLRVTGVGTEPAAVSSAVSVDWGKQPVFLTELVGVRLGHAVIGKQTDLRYSIQPSKAFWLILRDADIAHSARRECGIVLADWRDFAVPIDRAHSSPRETANFALMRSAGDDVMEHIIVVLVCMENGELDAQLFFAEGLEPVINEVPVFRDFAACVFVEHDFAENRLVQRLIVLCRHQKRSACKAPV